MGDQRDETIYLVGTSGHPNYEDEFVTAAWLRYLATARPDADVWLDCPTPGLASHLFDGLHPRLRVTDTLFRLVWQTKELSEPDAEQHVDQRVRDLGTPQYDLGMLTLRRATTVHVLGGGYVNALWPFHVGLLQAVATLRELTGVRAAATGLGLTPPAQQARLAAALKAFDHVSVRDAPSAELSGAEQVVDDAFIGLRELPGYGAEPARTPDGDVWVCLQSDLAAPGAFDAAVAATRAALTGPELSGRTVRYLEAIPGVDRTAFDQLSDLIPEANFHSFVRLWQEGFPAGPGQTWITTRSGLHLLAAASGAEGTAIEVNEDYERDKHASLVATGTGWSVTRTGSHELEAPSVDKGFPYRSRMLAKDKLDEAARIYPPAPVAETQPASPAAGARRGWLGRR